MWKNTDGYWRMYANGKCVKVHRYVWELYNGPIPEGYDVHHGDGKGNFDGEGNKNCNCICNLMLLSHSEHISLHKKDNKNCLGRKRTTDEKRRISERHMGKVVSAKTREKISISHQGMKASAETREKMSAFQRSTDIRADNTSGFRGVSHIKGTDKYRASIYSFGKRIHLGRFPTAEEAAKAYDIAALKYFGDEAYQNFLSR